MPIQNAKHMQRPQTICSTRLKDMGNSNNGNINAKKGHENDGANIFDYYCLLVHEIKYFFISQNMIILIWSLANYQSYEFLVECGL